MGIKEKLLQAVGEVDIQDIEAEALVDILVSRINVQNKMIRDLNSKNGMERQRLHDETEALHRERQKMRSDPKYGAYGEYFFLGRNNIRVTLSMQSGQIKYMSERSKGNDWHMQQITLEQWNITEQDEQIKKR